MQFGIFTITVLASIMAALVSASPIPAADLSVGAALPRAVVDTSAVVNREPRPEPEPICRFGCT